MNIQASATSSKNDFDFLQGKWAVKNKKLKTRLENCTEWIEFNSELNMHKTLNGMGNIENFYATFDNEPFEGMAIRLFNPKTKLWKIYWVDTSACLMDENPICGSFEDGIGKFYARDILNQKQILILYQWDATNKNEPIWSQAFSTDEGATWEWNWVMNFSKI